MNGKSYNNMGIYTFDHVNADEIVLCIKTTIKQFEDDQQETKW